MIEKPEILMIGSSHSSKKLWKLSKQAKISEFSADKNQHEITSYAT